MINETILILAISLGYLVYTCSHAMLIMLEYSHYKASGEMRWPIIITHLISLSGLMVITGCHGAEVLHHSNGAH